MALTRGRWMLVTAALTLFVLAMWGVGTGGAAPKRTERVWFGPGNWTPALTQAGTFRNEGVAQVYCSAGTDGALRMPIEVPNGASITKVTFFNRDDDETYDLSLQLVFSTPGVGADIDEGDEVLSDESAPIVIENPMELQATVLEPSPPRTVDRATRQYAVAALFPACGTTSGPLPSLLVDGVLVEYVRA